MRKVSIGVILLFALVAIMGCGKTTRTYNTPGGAVTVNTNKTLGKKESTVEIKTKEGSATVTTEQKKTISEAELGVPVYPGATVETSASYEGQNGSGMSSMQQHILLTPDSFDKVESFYKTNLKNVKSSFNQNQGTEKTAMFVTGTEKAPITVTIGFDKEHNQTMIHVLKAKQ